MKMLTRTLAFYTFVFIYSINIKSQNLVPNPSFESANCPTGYTGFPSQVGLYLQNWYSANCASPDPMTNCSSHSQTSVPDVWFGNQNARTGTNYIGFGFYGGWYEYIGVRLTQPLIAGTTYNVSFYVSCADNVRYASDAVGMYFSDTMINCKSGFSGPVLAFTPQVVQTSGVFLTDKIGWTNISGTYTATSNEEYIVIGCFKSWNTSALHNFGSGDTRCYYYIDDIAIEAPIILPIELISFNAKENNNNIELKWETASELNACYINIERSMDGMSFHNIQRINANGTTNNKSQYNFNDKHPLSGVSYYRLKLTDCDSTFTYSKIISVKTENNIGFSISPNPFNDELNIIFSENNSSPITIQIYNVLGELMYKSKILNKNTIIPLYELNKGIYTVVLNAEHIDTIYKTIIKQ